MERLGQGDPRVLGRYRVLARIGAGATATVYLGRSPGGRAVAVKVPHADLADQPGFRARFRREVWATTAVGGPHGPPVLDASLTSTPPWMATEFLPAVSLRDAVARRGPLPADALRRLAAGLAESLAAVHRAGIVHLDVKPANVLLTADGPRLIDFGIAAGARATGLAGSSGFMSPEQMAGTPGPPSDVYALGSTLAHARGQRGRDAELDAVIADCRHPDAAARPTAAELTARLAALAPAAPPLAAGWLPPTIMAAIDAEASAAANPPAPPRAALSRRLLVGAGASALVLGGATALDWLVDRPGAGPRPAPSRPPGGTGPAAAPTGTPPASSARPVLVQFEVTGDGPLASLAYAVNGRFTTLHDVSLTWRKSVPVARRQGRVDWRLRLTAPTPAVRCRVRVDGAEQWHGPHPIRPLIGPTPYPMDVSGSVAFRDPSPSLLPRVGAVDEEGLTP